jgi:7-cyano-7-deazaguanine reductase
MGEGMSNPDTSSGGAPLAPKFLGQNTGLPASPDEAVLDYVPNPRVGSLYLTRFAAPEFTSMPGNRPA